MSYLLAGLEAIKNDKELENVNGTESADFSAEEMFELVDLFETYQEFENLSNSLETVMMDIDFLGNVHDVIEENGVSKEIIKLVDPDQTLAKNGLFVSQEDFEEGSFVESTEALERTKEMLRSFWEWILRQLDKLKNLFVKLQKKIFATTEKLADKITKIYKSDLENLDSGKIDTTELKTRKVIIPKAFSNYTNHNKMVDDATNATVVVAETLSSVVKKLKSELEKGDINKAAKLINNTADDIKKKYDGFFRIKVTDNQDSDKKIKALKVSIDKSNSPFISDVTSIACDKYVGNIDAFIKFVKSDIADKENKDVVKLVEGMFEKASDNINECKKMIKELKGKDFERVNEKAIKNAVTSLLNINNTINSINGYVGKGYFNFFKTILVACNALVKSKKK